MTASSSFLATSSLAGLTLLRGDDRPLLHDASRVLGIVRDRAPGVATLFASPLMARPAPGQAASNVSWYGSHDQSPRLLREVPPALREQATEALRRMLRQALTLRADPHIGPLLPALLTVPSADSVMAAGPHPVLINWAAAPPDVDPTPEALRAHFDAVFGPLCGVTWPDDAADTAPAPSTAPLAGAAEAASGTIAAGAIAAGAVAAGAVAAGGAAQAAHQDGTPPDAPSPDTAASPADDALAGTTHAAAVGDGQAPPPHDTPPPPPQPWYARRGVIIGAAVLLALLILWLLWWLLWAPGGLFARAPEVGSLHNPMLESLRRERDRLRDLEGQACSPEVIDALRDGYSGPIDPRRGLLLPGEEEAIPEAGAPAIPLPPPTDLADLPATPASRMTALARTLEYSAALVLGESASEGTTMGTAFFVTPDTLVTNRHVIESLRPNDPLVITSQALGGMRRATVVARTRSSDIGGPDFAVLRLGAPEPAAVPLAIAPAVEKLSRVVTAGFPGYIAQSDADFQSLMDGQASAAPSMVFTSGEVSVVQRQASGTTVVVHTADMSQGNSGGPLVDLCGRVVGVNTFIGIDGESGRRGLYALGGRDLLAFLAANGVTVGQADGPCNEDGTGRSPEATPEATPEPTDTTTEAEAPRRDGDQG